MNDIAHLVVALDADPDNATLRRAYADALDNAGFTGEAIHQRQLVGAIPRLQEAAQREAEEHLSDKS